MTDLPNFSDYCEAACKALWGDPDQTNRKEMRWGVARSFDYRSQGGRSYNRLKKTWYDADAKVGGSTLELIAFDKGWLDSEGKPKARGARFFEAWRIGYDKKIIAEPPPEKPAPVKWPIRKRYPYHNAEGAHVYDVVRFDTEIRDDRFRYQRANGEWKLGKTPRVLYHLPETIAAVKADQRILVCEGERDSDTATALGYVATTNPEGLGKWLPRFDAVFADAADVVIVSDNDDWWRTGVCRRESQALMQGRDAHSRHHLPAEGFERMGEGRRHPGSARRADRSGARLCPGGHGNGGARARANK